MVFSGLKLGMTLIVPFLFLLKRRITVFDFSTIVDNRKEDSSSRTKNRLSLSSNLSIKRQIHSAFIVLWVLE